MNLAHQLFSREIPLTLIYPVFWLLISIFAWHSDTITPPSKLIPLKYSAKNWFSGQLFGLVVVELVVVELAGFDFELRSAWALDCKLESKLDKVRIDKPKKNHDFGAVLKYFWNFLIDKFVKMFEVHSECKFFL